jgi:ankyrin repeat protein
MLTSVGARFRWAVCQLDTLGKCRNRAMLRKSLATLPPTLDKTYDQILSTIPDEDSAFAMRILQWLAFSERPLSVEEVAEVIAMDITRSPVFVRDEIMEDPLDTLDICSSLVTVVTEETGDWSAPASKTQVVVLAHYSVKEYLVSDRIKKGQAAQYSLQDTVCHSIIAQGCLSYLCQFQNSEPMDQEILQQYKLAHYSAEFWIRHTKKTGRLGKATSKAAMHLLAPEKSAYLNWIRLWDPERSLKNFNIRRSEKESLPPPLYYAALHGVEEIVNTLLIEGADVNAKGPIFGSALQAALFGNHGQVVKILLDAKAEVNAQDGSYGNALQIATGKGDYQMVKLLLDKSADVNAWTRDFLEGNPLQIASEKGNRQIVQLLLDNGADVNAQSGFHGNALNAALSLTNGDDEVEETVKILIEAKIDVNVQGGFFGNALQEASHHGYKGVVRRLLETGARVNAQGGYYGNALQAASYWHYKEVVKMLLIAGANVNALGGEYGNALQAAASRIGQDGEEVVGMLLAAGANVTAKGGRYGSALQAASYCRFKEVMRRLLVAGADVYALGGEYGSPIEAAFLGRYDHGVEESEEADEILKMLFDAAGRILVHIE